MKYITWERFEEFVANVEALLVKVNLIDAKDWVERRSEFALAMQGWHGCAGKGDDFFIPPLGYIFDKVERAAYEELLQWLESQEGDFPARVAQMFR